MKEKEIQAFIESLEVKALNGKQQSFLLEGEECDYGGDFLIREVVTGLLMPIVLIGLVNIV